MVPLQELRYSLLDHFLARRIAHIEILPILRKGGRRVKVCESPIELALQLELEKFIDPSRITPQFEVAPYRLDFHILLGDTARSRQIAIECDGRAYHERYDRRDMRRDLYILQHHPIDAIYRFWGKDILYSTADSLYLLSMREPTLFNERSFAVNQSKRRRFEEVEMRSFKPDSACMWHESIMVFQSTQDREDYDSKLKSSNVIMRWLTKNDIG